MFEVKVEREFSAARHLLNYEGICKHPHGHNFVVEAWAETPSLDEANIALDFTVIKQKLAAITDSYDHTDLNEHPDFAGQSPSSELIAKTIYQKLKQDIPEIIRITVFETPKQSVSYFEAS